MKVFFWQNIPSHIQAPGLREFARLWPDSVTGVWEKPIPADRRALGWQDPDFGSLHQVTLGEFGEAATRELIEGNRDAVHIFSGLRAYQGLERAQRLARYEFRCPNLGLMAEPGIRMGWRGRIRPWRSRLLARPMVATTKLVLAMGRDGVEFYRRTGFPAERIFPYMYQAEETEGLPDARHSEKCVRLVYVGKFIRRKGLDLLLQALKGVEWGNWCLDIIGTGPERPRLEKIAEESGIAARISWRGRIPSSQIMSELARYDLCVVPSRFEGWGVVVNEAIQSGVPVVCSDRVTSRELIEASGAGAVYPALNPAGLGSTLERLIRDPAAIPVLRRKAREFSPRLRGLCVAAYLKRVMEFAFIDGSGDRPVPPWQEGGATLTRQIQTIEES